MTCRTCRTLLFQRNTVSPPHQLGCVLIPQNQRFSFLFTTKVGSDCGGSSILKKGCAGTEARRYTLEMSQISSRVKEAQLSLKEKVAPTLPEQTGSFESKSVFLNKFARFSLAAFQLINEWGEQQNLLTSTNINSSSRFISSLDQTSSSCCTSAAFLDATNHAGHKTRH